MPEPSQLTAWPQPSKLRPVVPKAGEIGAWYGVCLCAGTHNAFGSAIGDQWRAQGKLGEHDEVPVLAVLRRLLRAYE